MNQEVRNAYDSDGEVIRDDNDAKLPLLGQRPNVLVLPDIVINH